MGGCDAGSNQGRGEREVVDAGDRDGRCGDGNMRGAGELAFVPEPAKYNTDHVAADRRTRPLNIGYPENNRHSINCILDKRRFCSTRFCSGAGPVLSLRPNCAALKIQLLRRIVGT